MIIRKPKNRNLKSERGNALFTLFGAVAVIGALGISTTTLIRGPLKAMSSVNREAVSESQLLVASKMVMLDAGNLTAPDCDSDKLNEAREWRDAAGAGPDGVADSNGGGFLPDSIGAAKRDPWGTQYGYCVWDHGAAVDAAGCGGAGQKRLEGINSIEYPVIAIISAGPNTTFETPCRDFSNADNNADGDIEDAGDDDLITIGGDDAVSIYTYAEANQEQPGLWSLDFDAAGNVIAVMDSGLSDVEFSGSNSAFGGNLSLTSATEGLNIPDDTALPVCDATTEGQIRRNMSLSLVMLEICENDSGYIWNTLSSGGSGTAANNNQTAGPPSGNLKFLDALNNPSPNTNDAFSYSVAISGNIAVVGTWEDESDGGTGVLDAGRAYVFNATTGALITALDNPSPNSADYFGRSVAISGNIAVVGAYADESDGGGSGIASGRAYVFNATTGALITALNNPSPNTYDDFGVSVAISGNIAVVGAYADESDGGGSGIVSGRAYVFNATTGALITTLDNPSPNSSDAFGSSVAISGNVAVVGAYYDESDGGTGISDAGRSYVFNATTGALITALNNPSPNINDWFGVSVAISGNIAVVGAYLDESDGGSGVSDAGRAYVFNATTGALITALDNPSPNIADSFGSSVAISGNIAIVGVEGDESGAPNAGRAYVFNATTGALITALDNPSPNSYDNFGFSVAISGNIAVVGAFYDESDGGTGVSNAGRAYVFIDGQHYPAQVTAEQAATASGTIGSTGWVSMLASDTDGNEAGMAFVVDREAPLDGTDTASATISAVRESDPGAAGLAFRTKNAGGTLNTGMYLGTNEHLGLGVTAGDSAALYSTLQIGDHYGASWSETYSKGLLATGGGDLAYFGFEGDDDASASMLYSNTLKFKQSDIRANTVREALRLDAARAATFYGDITQQADASSVRLRHKSYSGTATDDGALDFLGSGSASETSAVKDTDVIGQILFGGYDGSGFPIGGHAAIQGIVNGAVSAGDIPIDLVFGTSAAGLATDREWLRITSDNKVGIGQPAPEAVFHVGGRMIADNGLQVGNDTICAAAVDAGTMRYTSGNLYELCDGTAWGLATNRLTDTDCSPIPFVFYNVSDAADSTVIASNIIRIGGLDNSCYMSMASNSSSAVINKNGVDQSGSLVIVNNGDYIQLKVNSGSVLTGTSTFVSLGNQVDEFRICRACSAPEIANSGSAWINDGTKLDGAVGIDVSGNYAYVASENGSSFTVVDISDPLNPAIANSGSAWVTDGTKLNGASEVKVSGSYAYVVSYTSDSLTVVDISDPLNPAIANSGSAWVTDGTKLNGASALAVAGTYAYVASSLGNSFTVIDISDPLNPAIANSGNAWVTDGTKLNEANDVVVSGNYAYVTSGTGDSFTVIDISDPLNPAIADSGSAWITDGTKLNGARGVSISGGYAYVTSYLDDSFTVIDITDPLNPAIADSGNAWITDGTKLDGARSISVSGNSAYVTGQYGNSLTIIDISDPLNPAIADSGNAWVSDGAKLNGPRDFNILGNYAYITGLAGDSLTVIDLGSCGVVCSDTGGE